MKREIYLRVTGAARHILATGATVRQCAERFGTTVARLASLNNIRNTDRIYVGQVLSLGIC